MPILRTNGLLLHEPKLGCTRRLLVRIKKYDCDIKRDSHFDFTVINVQSFVVIYSVLGICRARYFK